VVGVCTLRGLPRQLTRPTSHPRNVHALWRTHALAPVHGGLFQAEPGVSCQLAVAACRQSHSGTAILRPRPGCKGFVAGPGAADAPVREWAGSGPQTLREPGATACPSGAAGRAPLAEGFHALRRAGGGAVAGRQHRQRAQQRHALVERTRPYGAAGGCGGSGGGVAPVCASITSRTACARATGRVIISCPHPATILVLRPSMKIGTFIK